MGNRHSGFNLPLCLGIALPFTALQLFHLFALGAGPETGLFSLGCSLLSNLALCVLIACLPRGRVLAFLIVFFGELISYRHLRIMGVPIDYDLLRFALSSNPKALRLIAGFAEFQDFLVLAFAGVAGLVFFARGPQDRNLGVPLKIVVPAVLVLSGFTAIPAVPQRDQLLFLPIGFVRDGVERVATRSTIKTPLEIPSASALKRREEKLKANVVVVILESVGASATTVHRPSLRTTPFLAELSRKSLNFTRAYSVIPYTSKALVSIFCGFEPRPDVVISEGLSDGMPIRCLPKLLADHGYNSVFFQSANGEFDNRGGLVANFGFDEFLPAEALETSKFRVANRFGYEDAIMLDPVEQWIKKHDQSPFLMGILTVAAHYDYLEDGSPEPFHANPLQNRYLNAVRSSDRFLKDLFEKFKSLGQYDRTVFVVLGDHGDAFRETARLHGFNLYEETVHIPLLIHAPAFGLGGRNDNLVSQIDLLPSLVGLLGYEIEENHYRGLNFFDPTKRRDSMYLSCLTSQKCLGRVTKDSKFVINRFQERNEAYDLASDPFETKNIVKTGEEREISAAIERWRDLLLVTYDWNRETPVPRGKDRKNDPNKRHLPGLF